MRTTTPQGLTHSWGGLLAGEASGCVQHQAESAVPGAGTSTVDGCKS